MLSLRISLFALRSYLEFDILKDGVRKCWKENRRKYIQMVEQVKKANEELEILEHERESKRGLFAEDPKNFRKFDHLDEYSSHEIKVEIRSRKEGLDWITNNRELMKKLLEQFRRLTKSTEEIFEDELEEMDQGAFEFEYEYADGPEGVRGLAWYKKFGVRFWIDRGFEDLKFQKAIMNGELGSMERGLEKCKEKISALQDKMARADKHTVVEDEKAQDRIRSLRNQNSRSEKDIAEVEIEVIQNERAAARVQEDFEYDWDKKELTSWFAKRSELEKLIKGRSYVIRRIEIVISQMRECLRIMNENTRVEINISIIDNLYQLCYHIHHRRRFEEILEATYKREFCSVGKRKLIFKNIGEHYDYFAARDQEELEWWRTRANALDREALDRLLVTIFDVEFRAFDKVLQKAQDIQLSPDPPLSRHNDHTGSRRADRYSPNSPSIKPKRNSVPPSKASKGPDMTPTMCRTLLLKKATFKGKPINDPEPAWVDQLIKFFTSPDMFLFFRYKTKRFPRLDLYRFVNSFLYEELPKPIFDAFLIYCNYMEELFTVDYKKFRNENEPIMVVNKGWETCAENPVAGLRRKKAPEDRTAPDGVAQVEHWLREFAGNTKPPPWMWLHERPQGDWNIRQWINSEGNFNISESQFEHFMGYWSKVGRFFVYRDEYGSFPLES